MRQLALPVLLAAWSPLATAEALCPDTTPRPPQYEIPAGDDILVEGLRMQGSLGQHVLLEGRVRYVRGQTLIQGSRLEYWFDPERLVFSGPVAYFSPGRILQAERVEIDSQRLAHFHDSEYWLTQPLAYGAAQRVDQQGENRFTLEQASFSFCPKGKQDWQLKGRKMALDTAAGRGSGRDVTLSFKNTPVLYLPWVTFPLDDRRKSGFLLPTIGSSERRGFELATPYYWNIAPNQDATLTPHLMGKRGLMLEGEYRYLHHRGQGEIHANVIDDREFGDQRHLFDLRYAGRLSQHWHSDLLLNDVSDGDYFDDFGSDITLTSIDHLESRLRLAYNRAGWAGGVLWQRFETVDQDIAAQDRPYRRLPQVYLSTHQPLGSLPVQTHLAAEWVRFGHDSGDKDTGTRLNLAPALSLPLSASWYHLNPQVTLHHTAYDLDRADGALPANPSRSLTQFSLDGGLAFERQPQQGERLIRSLEPRLYYLYTPYRDQDQLPLFDSADYTFSFAQLFRPNRYSGTDRIGDANQLSAALSWRWIDRHQGTEVFSLSLGRIRYFEDYRVTRTAGEAPIEEGWSNSIVELRSQPLSNWQGRLTLEWDHAQRRQQQSALQVGYRPASGALFNVGYRFRRDSLEQADISGMLPLGRHWKLLARYNHSLPDDQLIEALAGIEYDSCCWRFRLVGQRYVTDPGAVDHVTHENAIYLQLELKGLTRIGHEADRLLERGILGYRAQAPNTY